MVSLQQQQHGLERDCTRLAVLVLMMLVLVDGGPKFKTNDRCWPGWKVGGDRTAVMFP